VAAAAQPIGTPAPHPAVCVYIAASLDGFIAPADGKLDWLDDYPAESFGYGEFVAGIGTIVMGRKTYDQIAERGGWPYPTKRTYVLTSRPLRGAPTGVKAVSNLPQLVQRLDPRVGGDLWVMGGGRTIGSFLQHGAIDRLDLFVIPVMLGRGSRLFEDSRRRGRLTLLGVQSWPNGVVRLSYRIG
jgi:dihydrofolate reductase